MLPWQSIFTAIEGITMIADKPGSIAWRKSSFSGNGADCVEVASAPVGMAVRDSKQPGGPRLAFDQEPWRAFLSRL